MAQTVVIQPNSTNTVKINVSSVPAVEITPPANRPVKVCPKVEFNITNITSGDGGNNGGGTDPGTHDHDIQIDQDIDVTNTDTAIGDALGAFYPAGTEIETILRNILLPSADPTITNYRLLVSVNGVPTEFSSNTYEWGTPVTVLGHKFTLNDTDDKFIDSENLFIVSSIYSPTTQSFPVSTFGVSDWSQLTSPQTLESPDIASVQISYTGLSGFSRQFSSQVRLSFLDTTGTEQATASASVRFSKRHWLISTDIDLVSGSFSGTYNDILSDPSTTIMDSGLTSSGNLSLTTDATALGETKFTYIVMPAELDMNTADGSVVSTGVFNVGNAFVEHASTLSYFSGFIDQSANNVNYDVRLFQSSQTQAYSSGTTLDITAS